MQCPKDILTYMKLQINGPDKISEGIIFSAFVYNSNIAISRI
jgi:hypothetical protein